MMSNANAVPIRALIGAAFLLFLLARLEEQRGEQREENDRAEPSGDGGEAAGQRAEQSVLPHRFERAFRQRVAEAGYRQRRSAAGKLDQRRVDADRCQRQPGNYETYEYPRRSQLREVYQQLPDGAYRPADKKRV